MADDRKHLIDASEVLQGLMSLASNAGILDSLHFIKQIIDSKIKTILPDDDDDHHGDNVDF